MKESRISQRTAGRGKGGPAPLTYYLTLPTSREKEKYQGLEG